MIEIAAAIGVMSFIALLIILGARPIRCPQCRSQYVTVHEYLSSWPLLWAFVDGMGALRRRNKWGVD